MGLHEDVNIRLIDSTLLCDKNSKSTARTRQSQWQMVINETGTNKQGHTRRWHVACAQNQETETAVNHFLRDTVYLPLNHVRILPFPLWVRLTEAVRSYISRFQPIFADIIIKDKPNLDFPFNSDNYGGTFFT